MKVRSCWTTICHLVSRWLWWLHPVIDVLRVGDSNAPPLGAPDAEVLNYLALAQRLLVTDNHKSMPGHLEAIGLRVDIYGDYSGCVPGYDRSSSSGIVPGLGGYGV